MNSGNQILVICDIEADRERLRQIFEEQYTVLLAENRIQAMAILQTNEIRLILLDMKKPEPDGYELLRTIKSLPGSHSIPLLAGTGDPALTGHRALELGADDVIEKPYDPYVARKRADNLMREYITGNPSQRPREAAGHRPRAFQEENDLHSDRAHTEIREMYESILDETKALISVIDAETYRIVYANQTAIRAANSPEGYIGCTCYKELRRAASPCEGCPMQKFDDPASEEKEIFRGERTYRTRRKFIRWNGKRALLVYCEDITDQHCFMRSERELADDKIKGEVLLSALSGGVALYHIMEDGTIRSSYISEGLANIIGYTATDFLAKYGENTKSCVYPEDLPMITAAIRKALETGTPIHNQYRLIKKDGSLFTVRFDGQIIDSGRKLPGEVASLYAVQTLVSDESVHEYAESIIRQKIFENIPGGVGLYDLYDGTICLEYLNDTYLTMMGLERNDRERDYGKSILHLVHPEDRSAVTAMVRRIEAGNRKDAVTLRVKNGSGVWKWLRLELSATKRNDGHYTGYGLLFDFDGIINAQLKMEQARKKEEVLISGIPGGIAVYRLKKDGRIATDYVSENLAAMCGYSADELLAYLKEDSLINLVPEDVPAVRKAALKAMADHTRISIMFHIYKKDRTKLLIRLDANIIESGELAPDETAVIYAVHSLVSDETQRIIKERKNLSSLLNSVPAGIGIYTIQNGVIKQEYMNDFFFELLYSTREGRQKYSGFKVLEAVYPDDIAGIQAVMGNFVKGASRGQVDFRLINGSGGWTWIHLTAAVSERTQNSITVYTVFHDCTESKEQQLTLLQNERAVSLAQHQGDISIWTYNIDKKTIMQLTASEDGGHLGYSMEIHDVPSWFIETDCIHPDDIPQLLESYRQLAEGAEKTEATYRLRNQHTGKYVWVHMFYQRMENTVSSDRIAVGFSMNVDKQQEAIERYHTEQALREQMNANVLMYIEYNLTKNRFERNGKLLSGYSKNEWEIASLSGYVAELAKTVEDAYAEQIAETFYSQNLLKAFAEGKSNVSLDYRSKERPDAPSTWYRTRVSLVKRPDTGDVMAFVYVEDIEKEKNRQLAIESSLIDGIESVTLIRLSDRQAWVLHVNNNHLPKELGMHFTYDDDFVNSAHKAVVSPNDEFGDKAAMLSNVIRELDKREVYQYSIAVKLRDGILRRQLFRFRYLDDRKANIVLSVSDITSVYLEDQENKKRLEDALLAAQHASHAKADFYSRMSHDMRTPMNGILGMTALSEGETDSAVLQENIKKIHESGEYLLNLINDTLDIQRIESGKMVLEPRIVNTMEMVENILDMIRGSAKAKGVTLLFKPGNADLNWYVYADSLRLKQIFVNLLSNAVKFTPTGGTVEFEFRLLERDGMISHDVIYVRDNGLGMSKCFLEHEIFKPFSQEYNVMSSKYAGSGLGLSIAKNLVELMGGRIEVESEPGVGTTFAVYLDFERVDPQEASASLQGEKTKSDGVSSQLKGKRILLAEDHPLNAEIARRLLQKAGCEVTWVKDGQEAVSCFAGAAVHAFDAVLMDVRMPFMDGLEASRQIRALEKADAATIPIIAMTANSYEEDKEKTKAAGMNAHLTKPVSPSDLYEALSRTFHTQDVTDREERPQ